MQHVQKVRRLRNQAGRMVSGFLAAMMLGNIMLFVFSSGSVHAHEEIGTEQTVADSEEIVHTQHDEESSMSEQLEESTEETSNQSSNEENIESNELDEDDYTDESEEDDVTEESEEELGPEEEPTTDELEEESNYDDEYDEDEDHSYDDSKFNEIKEQVEQITDAAKELLGEGSDSSEESSDVEDEQSENDDEETTESDDEDKSESDTPEDDPVSTEEPETLEYPTVIEMIQNTADTSALSQVLDFLGQNECDALASLYSNENIDGGITVFAPSNEAILNLVAAPGDVNLELSELIGNPDELCQIIATHVHTGNTLASYRVSATPVLIENQSTDDGLLVANVDGVFTADNATVTLADIPAENAVIHVVDQVILMTGPASIEAIDTNSTSPSLSGTIVLPEDEATEEKESTTSESEDDDVQTTVHRMPGFCVVVRIDGMPYKADVDGSDWSIEEGVVMIDPLKTDTLFDIIVRRTKDLTSQAMQQAQNQSDVSVVPSHECEDSESVASTPEVDASDIEAPTTHGGELIGITQLRNVVNYMDEATLKAQEEEGKVLGESTEEPEQVVAQAPSNVVLNGKGGLLAVEDPDPATVDTDADGVVDSLDTEPNNPEVTGSEDTDGDGVVDRDDPEPSNPDVTGLPADTDDEDVDSDTSNLLWWFVGGGAAITLWYLLWQRGGIEE